MLVVYNGVSFINMDNVTRATVIGKTISFYLNSGETYHLPFDTDVIATEAFVKILSSNSTHKEYIRISDKGAN